MARAKSKAVITAADGAGGMKQIHDHRFEKGEWPIRFVIEDTRHADNWLKYLSSECTARGWNSGGISQLNATENSGSQTVHMGAAAPESELVIVWERKRNGPLVVRAKTVGQFPLTVAQELLERVSENCRTDLKARFYFRGQLEYDGLPWRGELWLSDTLRLGPPSRIDETALMGPRIILVDKQVDGIDRMDAGGVFAVACRELSTFLSVVLRLNLGIPRSGRGWTLADVQKPDSQVQWFGYVETDLRTEMPVKGQAPPLPLRQTHRPDFSLRGIGPDDKEEEGPSDIIELWEAFSSLDAQHRRQFLQVASMWHLAISLGCEYQTTAFAWMVVATEALKPPEPLFRDHNIYDVVQGLLGKRVAAVLRKDGFRPQEVRNAHLHRGEFRGSEFVQHMMMPSFQDPTFDSARRVLTDITQATIIEWLRRGGVFTMPTRNSRKNWRRWVKRHSITAAAIAVGLVLGWLGHAMWQR